MKLLILNGFDNSFLLTPIPGPICYLQKIGQKNLYLKENEYLNPYKPPLGVYFGIIILCISFRPIRGGSG